MWEGGHLREVLHCSCPQSASTYLLKGSVCWVMYPASPVTSGVKPLPANATWNATWLQSLRCVVRWSPLQNRGKAFLKHTRMGVEAHGHAQDKGLVGLQGGSCRSLGRQLRLPPQLRLCHGAQRARAVLLASLRKASALHVPLAPNMLDKLNSLGPHTACRSWKYPVPALMCSGQSHICRACGAGVQARGRFRFRFKANRAPGLARGQPHALRVGVAGGRRRSPVGRRHHRIAALPGGHHFCRQRPCSILSMLLA